MPDLMLVALASLMAGFVDAIIGGGGLVLLPAMFSVYPQLAPAQLLGTNKATAVWGTALATLQYAKRVQMPWGAVLPALPAALVGSALGAWVVTQIDPSGLKKALPVLLALVLGYTLMRKDRLRQLRASAWWWASTTGCSARARAASSCSPWCAFWVGISFMPRRGPSC
jgi:uncharacterized membrane protein YfcA